MGWVKRVVAVGLEWPHNEVDRHCSLKLFRRTIPPVPRWSRQRELIHLRAPEEGDSVEKVHLLARTYSQREHVRTISAPSDEGRACARTADRDVHTVHFDVVRPRR